MSTTKTTATKKVVAGAVSFAMAVSFVFGGAVAPASAQSAAELQAQISSLLATIAALQAQLGTLSGGSTTTSGSGYVFTRSLTVGDTGADVMELQKFLNRDAATRVATSGAGSPGSETSYFGPATKAAVAKFQNKYASEVLAPVGLTSGTGYFGSSTRAKANALNASTGSSTDGGSVVVPNGSTVNVSLAAGSSATTLINGQAIGKLGSFTFVNTSNTPAKVTNLTFNRTGISNDATLSNVYLFDGAVRVSDSLGVSSGKITANNSAGIFTIPAGTSKTITVRADIAGSTSGQIIGVSLASVASDVTVAGSFPIAGPNNTIADATLGTVAFTYTGPSGAVDNPANDVRVFEARAVVSTHAMNLESIAFENRGTSSDGDLVNFRLFVDGVQKGNAVSSASNDVVTFDLTSNPVRMETGTRIIKVLADVVKGSGETYDIQIRRASDVRVVDAELGQPILATDSSTVTGFPVSAENPSGTANANTIAAGSLSVAKASDSPTSNVTVGATNVLWSTFEFRASGEDVKIEAADILVNTSNTNGGMDNVKVFVNGQQVGSTKDVTENTATEFTFGSSFIAKAGEITKVDIYGDAKTATSTNFTAGETVDVGIAFAAADTEGLNSGNTVSAVSNVNGNQRTMSASSLTGTKASGYGNQTMIAGTNNAKIGSFTLSAGSTEGINVNTVVIELSSANAASVTDLTLKDGGNTVGTVKSSPSTSNSYSVNFAIPASGTKTIDVYANIKSGANAGTIVATLDETTGGTGVTTANSATVGSDVTLQTITIGSGALTVANGVNPDDSNVIAGSSSAVKVGSFKFTAQYSPFTVQELKVKIPTDAATSVSLVTLKSGSTVVGTASVLTPTNSTDTYATSTFTGLTFSVPQNTEQTLDVYVTIPTIASGASTGKAISVLLDADEGFKAIDASGSADTSLAAADLNSAATSGKGTVYVRKSVPTLSSVALASNTLVAGSNKTIAKVKVAADSAGDIGWKKLVFSVDKTAALTLGATTTIALYNSNNTQIAGTFATITGSHASQSQAFATDSAATSGSLIFVATNEQQIAAGSSVTYELRATIGGIASGYNYINVSVPATSSSVVTDSFADIHTAVGDSSESFVWTDRSSINTVHSESTDDWTNDYLVDNLPLDLSTVSVTI